ncbi:TPA: phage tail protein [Streptococcus pyogenes]|uniref:phage tail tube protein n=1 Tax=Streptococcus pyogenes TaxID=1314 RepID=UPI000971D3D3|nr:phage tail protein [Streptococcus pyogenes]HER4652090.1 phage tail protein [Streptococcus pyogenes NGAS500]HER4670709.1 phage tail protein [Streptococcus pyogenes NGAS438]SDV88606.1 Phage major tail protein [Streptococcus pyogenes]SQG19544.1 major tail protein [Streptococcus pyogenes]VGS47252.1 major tail protein [Streptococcus pyogenes]
MANDTKNVTSAKPKAGGAIYSAPLGTTLPEDAKSKLDTKFKNLGYVSEDGVVNEDTRSSENIKAWGGDIVGSVQTEKEDKFTYKLIESLNVEVLKEVYGSSNVTGDLNGGIHIKSNSKELEAHVIVVDMIMNGGILKRIVLPNAKVDEVGEIVYVDGEVVGYETTLKCFPDEKGDTHHEYIVKPGEANKKENSFEM